MSVRQRQMLAPALAGRAVQAPRGGTGRLPGAPQGPGGLLLQLQRSHGNQFVQRLMARPAAGMAAAPAVDPGPADRLVRGRQAGSLPSRFSGVPEARATSLMVTGTALASSGRGFDIVLGFCNQRAWRSRPARAELPRARSAAV